MALDAHGCPACPHPGDGPAIGGSRDVHVNDLPALRVDDAGIHAACCGENTWTAAEGSPTVFINGKAAHRLGDKTKHCGGTGMLAQGSPNVVVDAAHTRAQAQPRAYGAGNLVVGPRVIPPIVARGPLEDRESIQSAVTGNGAPGPTPAPPAPPPLTSDLEVSVTAIAGPVAGAGVDIAGPATQRAITDATGTARFPAITDGAYQIQVSAAGFRPGSRWVTTVPASTTAVQFALTPVLTIVSEAIATAPPNRARTRIGVGEEVELTASSAASWTLHGEGSLSAMAGTTVVFRAGNGAAMPTITATAGDASTTINFEVVEPTFQLEIHSHVRHAYGRPDCGFKATAVLLPADVSFEHVEVRERNSPIGGSGFYESFTGKMHDHHNQTVSPPYTVNPPANGKGSVPNLIDEIYSGDPGGPPIEGRATMFITWEFSARGGPYKAMPRQQQVHVVDADGTCTTSKASATATRRLTDPSSGY